MSSDYTICLSLENDTAKSKIKITSYYCIYTSLTYKYIIVNVNIVVYCDFPLYHQQLIYLYNNYVYCTCSHHFRDDSKLIVML